MPLPPSPLLLQVQCQWGLQPAKVALLTSVLFGGMMLGSPFWGVVADTWGRRVAYVLTAAVTMVAGLASAAAPSFNVSRWISTRSLDTFSRTAAHVWLCPCQLTMCTVAAQMCALRSLRNSAHCACASNVRCAHANNAHYCAR